MNKGSKKAAWEHFQHEADIGIRGLGPTKESAFTQAAVALTAVITNPNNVEPLQEVHIICEAIDDEILFVDWLNSLLYEMATRSMLFSRFIITIDNNCLKAEAWGQNIDPNKHEPAVEIKGATYAELRVGIEQDGTWIAQCIVDV
jgi:tRNA nucleotidyltransferase (CCA-adding enzyme)